MTGFCLIGDIRGDGVSRGLKWKGVDLTACGRHLIDPGFGTGSVALNAMGMG